MPTYNTALLHKPEQRSESLLTLMEEEYTDAAIYLQLSRLMSGEAAAQLRQMSEQELAHGACLRGIYTLMTGSHPPAVTPAVLVESPENMLRRCYGREMRCLAQYEHRSADPEYGSVFCKLALQEQAHCRALLKLIAAAGRKGV